MVPMRLVLVTCVALAAAQAPLLAGPRVAPVASACPAERPHREPDADGTRDRCVARADATCPAGTALRTDATGQADACAPDSTDPGKAPKCPGGTQLRVAAGKDPCESAGPPTCPSGFKLKPTKGPDQCHP
jgi:hypothetical protein